MLRNPFRMKQSVIRFSAFVSEVKESRDGVPAQLLKAPAALLKDPVSSSGLYEHWTWLWYTFLQAKHLYKESMEGW